MHPDPTFAWRDEAAMRRFVTARGFAHLCVVANGRPLVVHAPVVVTDDGALRFHVARGNRAASALDGANALASIAGTDFYVSPDWYGLPDQVPTWNYTAVEVEGVVHLLDDDALLDQLDRLAHIFEATLAPKAAWTRDKLAPERLAAMAAAITVYELRPIAWRGTVKLGQDKPPEARRRVAAALVAAGRADAAAAMAEGRPA